LGWHDVRFFILIQEEIVVKKFNAIVAVLFAVCGLLSVSLSAGAANAGKLVVYSPLPLEFIDSLVGEFEKESGVKVEVIAAGTGELLKRIESEKSNPLGDVLWSGTIGTVKSKSALFETYRTPNEEKTGDAYKNVEGPLTRFDVIPSVIMVNTSLIGNVQVKGYADLLKPELKGKIAFANPAASSSSFEHLVNMLYAMGNGDPEKGWDYVKKFCKNLDGKLLGSSSAVYKGVADGEYTVGPTFEEGGANYVSAGAPVTLVYMEEGVIFRGDGIYIVKNAKNMDNAKKFLDFCTSYKAQKIMNDTLNRRTVRTDLPPSPILKPIGEIKVIVDDEAVTSANKQAWLDKFKDIFTSN
jgi:iron(III) transport system substrate-binding protein